MAALTNWYPSLQSAALSTDILFRSFDLYFNKWEYEGTGVYDLTGTKLTPSTSPAWTIDSLKSDTKKNLYVVDDGGYLCSVPVDSNTAAAVVFTPADLKRVADGTTAAVLTDTKSYQFYVLTPCSNAVGGEYGEYAGFTVVGEFTPGIEKVPLATGVPERIIRVDIAAQKPTLKGSLQNIGTPALKNLFLTTTYGDQTGGQNVFSGHDISMPFWEINLVGKNTAGKLNWLRIWKANITIEGGLNFGEKKHKEAKFVADVLQNQYVENAAASLYGFYRAN